MIANKETKRSTLRATDGTKMVDEYLVIPVGVDDDDDDLDPLHQTYPITSLFTSTTSTNPFHSSPNPMGTLSTAPSRSDLFPNRDTRVMSPTNEQQCVPYQRQPYQWHCQVCQMVVTTPVTCSHCGTYGHGTCLRLEEFQGLPFLWKLHDDGNCPLLQPM